MSLHLIIDHFKIVQKWLIALWNAKVQEEDHVYIVGDFAFQNENPIEN